MSDSRARRLKARVFRKKYPRARGGGWAPGWYATWRDERGRRRERRAGSTKGEAQLYLAERLQEAEERRAQVGQRPVKGTLLLADAVDDYERKFSHLVGTGTKVRLLRSWVARLGERIGHAPALRDVSPDLVEECLCDLRDAGRATATVNRFLSALKSLLSREVQRRRLSENPIVCIRQETENNARDRCLTEDEERELLAACRASDNRLLLPLVGLALTTGQRQGRLLSLRWSDVDFAGKTLTFRVRGSKTKGKNLKIPMLRQARDYLLLVPRGGEFVFESEGSPIPFSRLRSAFRTVLERAQLEDVVFHTLRHVFITRMAELGIDVKVIMQWVGHKTISQTMRYTHLRDSGMREAAELLDELPDQCREPSSVRWVGTW